MSSRLPTVTGKEGELRFASALVKNGFVPFTPVVDLGIDVVAEKMARARSKQQPEYLSFQVKTSKFRQGAGNWNWYVDEDGFRASKSVFYVFQFDDTKYLPATTKKDPFFNACIIPSLEMQKYGHWTTYNMGKSHSFDVSITPNMLRSFQVFCKKRTNSGIALAHFNDWKQLDC